jgi:hypothetical protein
MSPPLDARSKYVLGPEEEIAFENKDLTRL